MKRLLAVTACVLVLFTAAASAWASCKRTSFASETKSGAARHSHDHEHHGDHHSENSLIHCAPVDDVLPVATFSLEKQRGAERLVLWLPIESRSGSSQNALLRWVHGPPDSRYIEPPSTYLLISVLRI
jgi:hypothetical protein